MRSGRRLLNGLATGLTLVLLAVAPALADVESKTRLVEKIRTTQEKLDALPRPADLVDATTDFYARRVFFTLGEGEPTWNANALRWQQMFPSFRAAFNDMLRRIVTERELQSTMDSGRMLNSMLTAFSEGELEEIDTALKSPQLARYLAANQRAAPLVMRMMSAGFQPALYSEEERRRMSIEAQTKLSLDAIGDPAAIEEVVRLLDTLAMRAYRERIMPALTDSTAFADRLDSPVLRSEVDILIVRWRDIVGSR